MAALDATWHLLNFFAVPLGLGLLAPALAKLVWRRALRSAPWSRLAAVSAALCAAVAIGGLVIFGRDGRMATYGAMVLATATWLWWRTRGD